jgi:hypothetical protein
VELVEFHHSEFDDYRHTFSQTVRNPNVANREANALRRALLFLRRGSMWRELPPGTRWFEVELTIHDLEKVRVFPRAQWRKVAHGSFRLGDTVDQIRAGRTRLADADFTSKLQRVRLLVEANLIHPAILLIGSDKNAPLTILDGNHRLAVSMLIDPALALKRFRFICGFSPRMSECCWYQTNIVTLWRYARNLVRYMAHDPEAEIARFLTAKTHAESGTLG